MMDADWTLTEVVRVDADHTALYVLRNPGELHTATIEARPEYDSVVAMCDDDGTRPGWIRYFVTWSRSGSIYADQLNSLSLLHLVRLVSAWELRVANDPALAQQIEDFSRTTERLHFAAIENVQWGIPVTKNRLRVASDAYESQSRRISETIDAFVGRRESHAPEARLDFCPELSEAVMRQRESRLTI
jgi:hypothetical protein